MATAGPYYAGTITQGASGADDWTSLANMGAADAATADWDSTGATPASEIVTLTGFSVSLPAGATVTGVTVESNRKRVSGGGAGRDHTVQLLKAGVAAGNNKASASNWPTSLGVATYGGAADLWGTTWSKAEVEASDFGVSFKAQDTTQSDVLNVDYVRVSVDYTVPAAGGPGARGRGAIAGRVRGRR